MTCHNNTLRDVSALCTFFRQPGRGMVVWRDTWKEVKRTWETASEIHLITRTVTLSPGAFRASTAHVTPVKARKKDERLQTVP